MRDYMQEAMTSEDLADEAVSNEYHNWKSRRSTSREPTFESMTLSCKGREALTTWCSGMCFAGEVP